jgi:hypothetical protein
MSLSQQTLFFSLFRSPSNGGRKSFELLTMSFHLGFNTLIVILAVVIGIIMPT